MPTKWYEGKVIDIKDASSTTKIFYVKVDQEEMIQWRPGQFVVMDLPVSEKRLNRWRSYSIANIPNEENILEFIIVHLEGGMGTDYLFKEVEIGTSLKFKEPDGAFCIPQDIDHDMVMVSTGTGVAPFRSMLLAIEKENIKHRKIHLIFGTRTSEGLLYQEDFERMKKSISGFTYDAALSRESSEVHHKGYVHPIYMNAHKDISSDKKFYLCGWTQMIDEAVANIIVKMGYDKSQVVYELYG